MDHDFSERIKGSRRPTPRADIATGDNTSGGDLLADEHLFPWNPPACVAALVFGDLSVAFAMLL
jgi:hypothetical protein